MKKSILSGTVLLLLFFILNQSPVFALEKIEVTTVDQQATEYGTFQSHNQKVVANQYGIFMTHLHSRNIAYDQNTWRLSRSTDGGRTFTTIYESTNGTSAPVIETDSQGNIYLAHPDWGIGYGQTYGLFYIFTPGNNFTNPIKVSHIPDCADGKYSMVFDKSRSQFYFFSNKNTFTIIGMNGEIKTSYKLTTSGNSAYVMYPHLYLDSNNDLYAAWTTQKFGVYMYWDIHFMRSKDGGLTWKKPNGQGLTPPVVADQTGPTDRITLNDEFDVHTWLWTLIVKNGKVHLPYLAQSTPHRQHYVRYDLATAQKDLDIYPEWKGETLSFANLDGFCATRVAEPGFPIYCISRTLPEYYLAVLVSYDNGTTWHDYAKSDFSVNNGFQNIWSIGGAREVTADGYIIGSYTDQGTDNAVRFFKIKAVSALPTPTPIPALISHYNLNETSESTVSDSQGANNGTAIGTTIVNGVEGKARNFNGTSDYISIPSSNNFSFGTWDFSLGVWYKGGTQVSSYPTFFGQWPASGQLSTDWILGANNTGKVTFYWYNYSTNSALFSGTSNVLDNKWHYIAFTRNSGIFKIYVDGVLENSNSTSPDLSVGRNNFEFDLGAYGTHGSHGKLAGILDEVGIYNYAMSADQIKNLYLSFAQKSIIPGDLDKNGKIDIFDYNLMIQNFGNTTCGNVADIDGNCKVDIFDYNILVGNFGKTISGIALGIYQPQDNTYDGKAIDRYIKEVDNKKPAFAWLPMSWKRFLDGSYREFDPQMLEEFRTRGIMPGITWDASKGSVEVYENRQDGINQTEFSWKAIISGTHDEYITRFAKAAAAYHYPFILRTLHEMNGTWYPWGYNVNGNTNIADYVTAWKHIVDIFRKENATNVQFIWNPTAMDTENMQTYGTMLTQAYPGDNYVDWVGLDGYSTPKNGWLSLQDRFKPGYDLITSFSNRPMILFEVGAMENFDDPSFKANWITQGFLNTIPHLFPEVKVAVWFNSKDGAGRDFSIDTPPEVLAAWKQVVASPLYQGSLP